MPAKGTTDLLNNLVSDGVALDVTNRSRRRIWVSGMAPIRDVTTARRRPEPGGSRGRPFHVAAD